MLAFALATALAFSAAARSPLGDAEAAGAEALRRLATGISEGVLAEWKRMLCEGALASAQGQSWRYGPGEEPRVPRASGRELRATEPEGAADFPWLLARAGEAELVEGGHAAALELVLRALELPALGREQRALGRLRAVQLAARAGDARALREHWERARPELGLDSLCEGWPAFALAALAAAPALEEEERAPLRAELERAWAAGELALPAGGARVSRAGRRPSVELAPELAALRERIAGLAPALPPEPELERWIAATELSALAAALGGLPEAPEAPDEPVVLRPSPLGPLHLAREGGALRASFVDLELSAAELEARCRAKALLPAGFELDFGLPTARGAPEGRALGLRVELWGEPLGFVLRHPAPASLVRAERRRAGLLRWGLCAMALFALGAGLLSFRALRRERRLAELERTFVAAVSHELRTPLASLLLMAENLEEGRAPEPRRYYAPMRRETQRLARLVDDVLDLSRLERGHGLRLCVEEVELERFAAELEREARERAESGGGSLACERAPVRGLAQLDRFALLRAVLNLVDNGLRHGGGTLALALAVDEGGLRLALRDRGPGIAPRHRERIFEPFQRLDSGSASPGTGLGLSIAREIARAHGGELRALDPREGPGVVFELRVPLARCAASGGGESLASASERGAA